MKAIMISIKPKWCAKIMNGEKTIEVRKDNVGKAVQTLINENGYAEFYVYCTKNQGDIVRVSSPYTNRTNFEYVKPTKVKWINELPKYEYSSEGKVIFKFRCYKVEEIWKFEALGESVRFTEALCERDLCVKSCLTPCDFEDYLGDKIGSDIYISDLEIFDKPKELSEFRKWYRVFESTEKVDVLPDIKLRKAPQSFAYIEVE